MIKVKIINVLLLGLLLTVAACKKDPALLSENEAAELITQALIESNEGLAKQAGEAGEIMSQATLPPSCDFQGDSILVFQQTAGLRTYAYECHWTWNSLCTGPVPVGVAFHFEVTGNYDMPKMSSMDSLTSEFVISGFLPTEDYTLEGSILREGLQTSHLANHTQFSSNLEMDISELRLDRNTYAIKGGQLSFILTGATLGGEDISFGGTVSFPGNDTAVIQFMNGGSYTISLVQ